MLYNILPETEGRTLEDIENHFADRGRKFTDRFIVKKCHNDKENQGNHLKLSSI